MVEKKSLAQQREQERKERIRKRKEQILQEKLAKAAVYDEDDEESDYDSEAEDKRIGDEVPDDDDELLDWPTNRCGFNNNSLSNVFKILVASDFCR